MRTIGSEFGRSNIESILQLFSEIHHVVVGINNTQNNRSSFQVNYLSRRTIEGRNLMISSLPPREWIEYDGDPLCETLGEALSLLIRNLPAHHC
jgi:hypothetical protein